MIFCFPFFKLQIQKTVLNYFAKNTSYVRYIIHKSDVFQNPTEFSLDKEELNESSKLSLSPYRDSGLSVVRYGYRLCRNSSAQ